MFSLIAMAIILYDKARLELLYVCMAADVLLLVIFIGLALVLFSAGRVL